MTCHPHRPLRQACAAPAAQPCQCGHHWRYGRSAAHRRTAHRLYAGAGYAGQILPVNPGRDTVQGLKAYACVSDLPVAPDAAFVAVAASKAVDVIRQRGERGCASAILFSAGFAEAGPIAMFGLGGIFVEILKDVTFRRCLFGVDVATEMIRSVKGAPLLLGARGRPPVDIEALALMLSHLSALAVACGLRLQSIDLNPVFAMPQG